MVILPPAGGAGGSEQSSRVTGRPTPREGDPAPEDGASGGRVGERLLQVRPSMPLGMDGRFNHWT